MNTLIAKPRIGDRVRYYNFTTCVEDVGVVTADDVPCLWRSGLPLGVEIDGKIRRAYREVSVVS